MTRIRPITLAVALGAALAANAASHDLATFVGEYDLDRDGSVSKEEFQKERERRFAATDANHDGAISLDEYVDEFRARLMFGNPKPEEAAKQLSQTQVRFDALDSNSDGRISSAEFYHSGWTMFTEHEYNRDGAVSLADKT